MTVDEIGLQGEPRSAPPQAQATPPHRILVAEDEAAIRHLITGELVRAGYDVDVAENGELAWKALQARPYDLLITDNSMPKVSGLELLHKLHDASRTIPVIMATGALPEEELARSPWLQPAATLLKPYTTTELLGMVKKVLGAAVPILLLLMAFLCLPSPLHAQEFKQAPIGVPRPNALVMSAHGKCQYSDDGVAFSKLKRGHVLYQGDIVRTGDAARTDLFFRRTGTTVRLQADTTVMLEEMTVTMQQGHPIVHTLLDLRAGRIFTVVRSEVAGSALEIRNAAGRAIVQGSGIGRYIITADGTHVSALGSYIPLKVISTKGITIISTGQEFDPKEGKMLPGSPSFLVEDLIQLDELQAATERLAAKERPPK